MWRRSHLQENAENDVEESSWEQGFLCWDDPAARYKPVMFLPKNVQL